MKTVLCYGDSNTWGYDPATGRRFPCDVRWPGVLAGRLGAAFRVIEEGLGGRTTVWDDPIEGDKNGKAYLAPCLASHAPLDAVVLMLGSNDLKARFALGAFDIAEGAGALVSLIRRSECGRDGGAPRVLLVSPIEIGDMSVSPFRRMFGGEAAARTSRELAPLYREVAFRHGCEFLDAAAVAQPSPRDALHLDEIGHRRLGAAIADKVLDMLRAS